MPPEPDLPARLADMLLLAKTTAAAAGLPFRRSDVIRVLREGLAKELTKEKALHPKPRQAGFASDESFLSSLESNPTYAVLDVRQELGKATAWASVRGARVSQRRFVNWLNKALADSPMRVSGTGQTSRAPAVKAVLQEPTGWRDWARENMMDPANAEQSWASFDASTQRYITEQTQKNGR